MTDLPLTKVEYTRLISVRATQIANGAKALVDVGKLYDPVKIAEKEFSENKIPLDIIRPLPDGRKIHVTPLVCNARSLDENRGARAFLDSAGGRKSSH